MNYLVGLVKICFVVVLACPFLALLACPELAIPAFLGSERFVACEIDYVVDVGVAAVDVVAAKTSILLDQ